MTTILEQLLKPVLTEEEWQSTRQQAVRKIHQAWSEENEQPTEAEVLEIVRLGLLAKEQEIAVSIGDRIATRWVNNYRFVEALELCQQVLAIYQDYRILGTVARAEEVLGSVQEAVTHYQQALNLCPEEELISKASTLNNMALQFAHQGDISRALALWEAVVAALGQIRAYRDLVIVLGNLGLADERNRLVYLAQAMWLTLRIQAPLADTIYLIRALYDAVPEGDELEALVGTTAIFFCNYQGKGYPQLEKFWDMSWKMLAGAAGRQGIETKEAFDAWFVQQRLNDPEYFLPRLRQSLEEIVGEGWLFDRSCIIELE
ncbi:MAG: hypothetical protein PUP92_39265 [Rhizonema sp. PD38]|nr:hypothetical protein [Rhizonema sp. PD38]